MQYKLYIVTLEYQNLEGVTRLTKKVYALNELILSQTICEYMVGHGWINSLKIEPVVTAEQSAHLIAESIDEAFPTTYTDPRFQCEISFKSVRIRGLMTLNQVEIHLHSCKQEDSRSNITLTVGDRVLASNGAMPFISKPEENRLLDLAGSMNVFTEFTVWM